MPRYEKDMQVIRETASFKQALNMARADLKDYNRGAKVVMEWDLSPEANRDRMFRLKINGEEAILDLEELLSYTRVV